jgi:hypothetical protein
MNEDYARTNALLQATGHNKRMGGYEYVVYAACNGGGDGDSFCILL